MKTVKYYQVSNLQLFLMALLIGITAAGLITINMMVKEYLLLPTVVIDRDNRCVSVENFRNADAYTCADVGVILRNYRERTE